MFSGGQFLLDRLSRHGRAGLQTFHNDRVDASFRVRQAEVNRCDFSNAIIIKKYFLGRDVAVCCPHAVKARLSIFPVGVVSVRFLVKQVNVQFGCHIIPGSIDEMVKQKVVKEVEPIKRPKSLDNLSGEEIELVKLSVVY